MFDDIPEPVRARMITLETIDGRDRHDGTSRQARLRQIAPESGRFLTFLAACAPEGAYVEVGTSGGYSTLWIALACRATGRRVVTCEVDPGKAELARQTFQLAQVEDVVQLHVGDARDVLRHSDNLSFCFLDTEKDLYAECYELAVARMVPGGLLVADNAISHADELRGFLGVVFHDPRVDALVVPVGNGQLLCRRREA